MKQTNSLSYEEKSLKKVTISGHHSRHWQDAPVPDNQTTRVQSTTATAGEVSEQS